MPSARADELLVDCRSVDEILLNSDVNDHSCSHCLCICYSFLSDIFSSRSLMVALASV